MTNVVAHYSGGLSSRLAAHRACEEFGANNVTLLFADTRTEDADSYRFIAEGAEALGARLETVCDGRDIWQVMKDERFLGNSRVAAACVHSLAHGFSLPERCVNPQTALAAVTSLRGRGR